MLEKLMAINVGLNRRFPGGNEPFQIITRLVEECGELAGEVNHFEGSGVKRDKHGAPDRAKLAKEVQQVLCCALQVAQYCRIEEELKASLEHSYQRLKAEGFLDE